MWMSSGWTICSRTTFSKSPPLPGRTKFFLPNVRKNRSARFEVELKYHAVRSVEYCPVALIAGFQLLANPLWPGDVDKDAVEKPLPVLNKQLPSLQKPVHHAAADVRTLISEPAVELRLNFSQIPRHSAPPAGMASVPPDS